MEYQKIVNVIENKMAARITKVPRKSQKNNAEHNQPCDTTVLKTSTLVVNCKLF